MLTQRPGKVIVRIYSADRLRGLMLVLRKLSGNERPEQYQ